MIYVKPIPYVISPLLATIYADHSRSFWTLSGSPTLLRHPSLLGLAMKSSYTPEQAVYKLCQLFVSTHHSARAELDKVEYNTALRLEVS